MSDAPLQPPQAGPPLLLERDFTEEPLTLRMDAAGRTTGQPIDERRYGDFVLDAVMSLQEGDEHDGYGLFVRQSTENRYAAFVVSMAGAASVMILDEAPLQLAGGQIPASMTFHRGLGARNRL